MFFYEKALLKATYKEGRQLTEEHAAAEYHRFKQEYLFKTTQIPKDAYVSRLIQHFLILKAIESQLKALPDNAKAEINAFFTLSYLEHLWRTPAIEKDLHQLGVDPKQIKESDVAPATQKYLRDIEQFTPKILLGHFLIHVAGFMHGGSTINRKYIKPSNQLTDYQISTHQYDFSAAASSSAKKGPLVVYTDLMDQMNTIDLNEEEYNELLEQGKSLYATMVDIYDDLCVMHTQHRTLSCSPWSVIAISMVVLIPVLKLLSDFSINPESSLSPR